MAANQIGLNQIFPIYNENGTPFHDLVLRKGVVDSIVMSLGDKITGDVFYKDNTLQVTMKEYVVYNGIHYSLVNPPTIVREGMVADNGELKGMTKYSFEFYHPMCQLSNFPFTDVATKTGEEKYLSQNKTFSWIGKPQDYIDKLNKNLQGTVWYVRKSDRFPVEKDDELSEVQQFDNVSVAEAIKRGYEIWGIPYIVSQLPSTDPLYAQGKRFVVEYGLPSNEIYESESARQLDTPFVFQMGQGVGLKNNSRTPRNNKIVTRIAGYGSEDNVPYGYPQIVWTGNQDWDYTINNDPDNPLSYPIYKGIVGGQYVKLIKHPFTRTHLMPSIFTETVNKKVNPNAVGYDPTIEIKDYYDAIATQEYPYVNEINLQAPSYESHEFADIKPELDADRNTGIVSAVPLNADLTPADHWDDTMDDDGNYLQSYFQITLPQLSFDLYACAAITQEMEINMRSGACIGCTFPVQVDWDDYKRNFYDEDGNFVPDGAQRDLTKYPKSNLGQISVVVQKDNSTFGTLMPNIYQQPQANDLFVFIGISLPLSYIANAEERLDDAMKTYMLENNVYYFDYPLKFDEHFLATHTYILEQIRPNSIIHFDYGGVEQQLFVKQLTVKYGNAPLPQYDITLTDNIEVVLNQIGQVADDVEKLSSLIAILRQSYNRNVWNELAKKLSKTQDDTAQGFIRFMQGLQVGNQFVSGILGEGGVFRKDADGKTYIEADKMYVRMKAYFDSVEIREYQHTSGNRIASQAKGFTASRVEWLDASGNVTDNINNVVKFRCYWRAKDDEHETQNQFVVGDQAFMEYSDVVDGNLVQKRFWRVLVGRNVSLTEDGEAWIDLSNKANDTITYIDHQGTSRTKSVTGFEPNSSIPQPEDDICQLGNVWDTERQGAIIEYVSGGDAPSYQIFQGIDSFSLNGKNMVGLGYSSLTGKAYMNVYGDAYIGDPQGSTYVKYEQRNSATHAPKLTIKAVIEASSPIADGQTVYNDMQSFIEAHSSDWTQSQINTLIHTVTDPMQAEIDGAIETWYMTGVPTLNNLPASGWTTDDEKDKHLGDLYYDKATGHGYRFMYDDEDDVYMWVILTDEDVTEALRIANQAQDTADGKRTIYVTWGAWVKNNVNTLEVGDIFMPDSDTTQGGMTYKANKVYKCTTAGTNAFQEASYTDDSAFNGYINAILNGTGSSGDAAVAAAAQKAIKDALGGGTIVDGGLLLTSLIAMRKKNQDNSYTTWAGISGMYDENAMGGGIAAWYGGGQIDHEASPSATGYAKSLLRFDGSGYLASGNITWNANGIVTIANVYSDVNGTPVPWSGATLQYINNLSTLLPTTVQQSVTYLDPTVSFWNLKLKGKDVATQEWVGNNYLSIAFFNRLFQTYNGTTRVNANDTTSTIDNIKAMFGFWTEQYISALGKNSSGGGGGGDIDMTTVWSAMANNTNEQINLSHLTTALSGYATQSWVYQQLTGGTVTAVKVGNTSYSPTDGVVSLPAYPTVPTNVSAFTNDSGYVTSSGVTSIATGTGLTGGTITSTGTISINSTYQTYISHGESAYNNLGNYLPLSGGTISNTKSEFSQPVLTVNNDSIATWLPTASFLASNMVSGQYVGIEIGKAMTTNNVGHLSFYYAGDSSTSNRFALGFYDNTDLLVVRADGNVGIGTSAPTNKLHINKNSGSTPILFVENTSNADWSRGIDVMYPNLSNDSYCNMLIGGKAQSSGNSAYLAYYHANDGGSGNKLVAGFYGNDQNFEMNYGGLFSLKSTSRNILSLYQTNTGSNIGPHIQFYLNDGLKGAIGYNNSKGIFIENYVNGLKGLWIEDGGNLTYQNNIILDSGNYTSYLSGYMLKASDTFSGTHTYTGSSHIFETTGNDTITIFKHTGSGSPVPFRVSESSSVTSNDDSYGVFQIERLNTANGWNNAGASLYFCLKNTSGSSVEVAGISGINTQNGKLIFRGRSRAEIGSIDSTGLVVSGNINSTYYGIGQNVGGYGTRSILRLNSPSNIPVDIVLMSGTLTSGSYGDWTLSSRGNENSDNNFYIFRGEQNAGNASQTSIFRIDSANGYVTIGQNVYSASAAAEQLDVRGNVRANGFWAGTGHIAGRAGIRINSTSTAYPSDILLGHSDSWSGWNNVYWSLSARGSGEDYRFSIWRGSALTSENELFVLTRDLNVGVGTTSPSYKLHVAGVIYSTTGIFSDGYVSALGQNTSSDIRKKDIKENFALSVEDIAAAPMIKYEWKDNKEMGMQVGSIAQYWESVLPESIHDDKDGFKSMQYGVIALLSSISVARKVQDHERRIKELEKECERLRFENEQLRLS